MLNTGVGPTINHRQKQPSYLQKKPINPLSFPRYGMSQSTNQYRPPMSNMPLQTNTLNLPRTKDGAPMPNMSSQLQQGPGMKMDHLNTPNMKKLDSPYVMDRDMAMSPSSGKLMASRRDTEAKGDQLGQMPEGIQNMSSPAQSIGENKTMATAMMMKMSEKELAKASDITTISLRIGTLTFKNCKISTKIHYGKRQIAWEVSEIRPSGNTQEKTPSKRKFEVQFSDIERIDLNTMKNTLLIDTREKPQEYKEYNPVSKKSQMHKDGNEEFESDMSEDIVPINGRFIIEAIYPKDAFTKTQAGKPSQQDKLMRAGLPLTINGKPVESFSETPNKNFSMGLAPGDDGFQLQNHHTPQRQGKQNFPPMMMRTGSSADDMKFPNLDIGHQSSFRGNLNSRNQQMYSNEILQLMHSESETMMDDPLQPNGPVGVELGANEEEEEDDDEKEFPTLTKEKRIEIKKFEAQLKTMKPEDKAEIILETIKPKRFGINPNSKKIYKCPIYKCSCQKHTPSLLKSHLSQKHKKLVEMGFNVDESGLFTWKPEAIDFVLMVTKMYPRFVKNIIREAKLTS